MSAASASDIVPVFDKDRLRLARQLRRLRKSDLARLIDVTPTAVGQYEAGTSKPSAAKLAKASLQLGLPVQFFASGDKVGSLEPSHTFFRSLRRTSQAEREQAVAHAVVAILIVEELERHVGLPELDLPEDLHLDPDRDPADAELVAREMRSRWSLGVGPISHLVHMLEHHGIIVIPFDPSDSTGDIDAFSRHERGRPVVVLSGRKQVRERSRFDAAHELGHLVMHPDAEPASRPLERQAHRFASAFLMPRESIINDLPTGRVNWAQLSMLKRTWGVSMAALLYRARELDVMPAADYEKAMKYMSRRGWRRKEPGDHGSPEEPAMLNQAFDLLDQHGTSREDFARLLAMPVADLHAFERTHLRLAWP